MMLLRSHHHALMLVLRPDSVLWNRMEVVKVGVFLMLGWQVSVVIITFCQVKLLLGSLILLPLSLPLDLPRLLVVKLFVADNLSFLVLQQAPQLVIVHPSQVLPLDQLQDHLNHLTAQRWSSFVQNGLHCLALMLVLLGESLRVDPGEHKQNDEAETVAILLKSFGGAGRESLFHQHLHFFRHQLAIFQLFH
jgi:hypothetical protein